MPMNARLPRVWVASLLIAGAGLPAPVEGECIQPPAYTAQVTKHGHAHWADGRLIAFSHNGEDWSLPPGWVPVGADRVRGTCARFPLTQAAVLVLRDQFRFRPIEIPQLQIRVWRVAPVEFDAARLAIVDAMIASTFEAVADLFPLGLRRGQRADHSVLVTVNLAGDGSQPEARLFPNPGTNLSVIFSNLDDPRGRELFIHTSTHLLNRRRARRQTEPEERALPRAEYQEMVATWAELALIDDARRSERFDFLMQNYQAVMDGDIATTPSNPLLEPLSGWQGPIGLHGVEPMSFEVSEFQHYVLAPLLMLAVDGLLERAGATPSLLDLLREVHAGRHRGLLAALAKHLARTEVAMVRGWISGVRVPEELARAGLVRLR